MPTRLLMAVATVLQLDALPFIEFLFPFDGQVVSWHPVYTRLPVLMNVHASEGGKFCLTMQSWIRYNATRDTYCHDVHMPMPELWMNKRNIRVGIPLVFEAYLLDRHGNELVRSAARFSAAEDPVQYDGYVVPASLVASPEVHRKVVRINSARLSATRPARYRHLVQDITDDDLGAVFSNSQYSVAPPGDEPYRLLTLLAKQHARSTIVDLGTLHGVSAFALAEQPSNTVLTFDVVPRQATVAEANGLSKQQLSIAAPNVVFVVGDASESLGALLRAPLISLDTVGQHTARTEYTERCRRQSVVGKLCRGS